MAGRLPDPARPDEVLASFTLQQQNDVQVGTIIHVPFFATSQASLLNGGGAAPRPAGPIATLRVVGIEASEIDFPAGSTPLDELLVTGPFGSPDALHRNSVGYAIRLKGGASELPRFEAEVNALKTPAGVANEDGEFRSVEASIHGQAVGWWILALVAIVGVAVLYQSLARQAVVERPDYSTMTALGVYRRQLVSLGMACDVLMAGVGAVGAVLVAVALSPLAPLGEARLAETSSGLTFDELVLPIGALIIVVAVLVLGLWPVWESSRTARTRADSREIKPSAVARLAARALPRASSSALATRCSTVGRRQGRRKSRHYGRRPGSCGIVRHRGVRLQSLAPHGDPALYGDTYQLDFGIGQPDPSLVRTLEHDPRSPPSLGFRRGSHDQWQVGRRLGDERDPWPASCIDRNRAPACSAPDCTGCNDDARSRRVCGFSGPRHRLVVHPRETDRTPPGGRGRLRFRYWTGAPVSEREQSFRPRVHGSGMSSEPHPGQVSHRVRKGRGGIGILAAVVPGQRGRAAVTHYLNAYPSIADRPSPRRHWSTSENR